MKNKKTLIILLLIMLIIIVGLLYYWYERKLALSVLPQPNNTAGTNSSQSQPAAVKKGLKRINFGNGGATSTTAALGVVKKELNKDDLMRLAADFAERFGSYSNQSNHRNVYDTEIFMSQKMLAWANSYLAKPAATSSASEAYYGITTMAVAETVKDFDDSAGSAIILVQTRRQEASSAIGNVSNAFNQNIIIKLVKENTGWKVDSAVWQDK